MANILTGLRIVCSFAMLFVPPLSLKFRLLYIICGLTDMADGTAARLLRSESRFGEIFDTAADMCFAAVSFFTLLPLLDIPLWLWIWLAAVLLIKTANIISGFVLNGKPAAVHTVMNKITGLLLFLYPFTFTVIDFRYGAVLLCTVATLSAVGEGKYIRMGKVNDRKSV